jgi:hypothetical protein
MNGKALYTELPNRLLSFKTRNPMLSLQVAKCIVKFFLKQKLEFMRILEKVQTIFCCSRPNRQKIREETIFSSPSHVAHFRIHPILALRDDFVHTEIDCTLHRASPSKSHIQNAFTTDSQLN